MSAPDDRRMFAPLLRGEAISPSAKLVAVLRAREAGFTVGGLADELLRAGFAVGPKAPVAKRIGELLTELEDAARVERIPDGRYRAVRPRAATDTRAAT